jgi:hypothetical protein
MGVEMALEMDWITREIENSNGKSKNVWMVKMK